MEAENSAQLNLQKGLPLIPDPTAQPQRTPRSRRKAKRKEKYTSDGLLVDLREVPEESSSANAGFLSRRSAKPLKRTETLQQTDSLNDTELTPAEAAKRKWANPTLVNSSNNQFSQISTQPHNESSTGPKQSALSLLKSLLNIEDQTLPAATEGKKPPYRRKRHNSRKASKMGSTYIPPHLRPKAVQAQTQPAHGGITLPSNGVADGAQEPPSPPTEANGNESVVPGVGVVKCAGPSATHGKQPLVKHVQIVEPIQNRQSYMPQSTSDKSPNGTPDGHATSDEFHSTPTAATTFDQQAQSPCPKITTPPPSANLVQLEKAENGKSKQKKGTTMVKRDKDSHRHKQPSGWLTKEERKAMRSREQNSDTEHDDWGEDNWDSNNIQNLVDWEGNWLPAPVEWEGRRGFKRHNYFENIADWIDESNVTIVHMPAEKNNFTYVSKKIIVQGELFASAKMEIAPREWIPIEVDNQTLQTYWRNLQASNLQLVDEEDAGTIPFWQLYVGNESQFQIPLEVPDAKLDPADELEHKGMYRKGKSDENTSNEQIKKQERLAKISEQRRKAVLRNDRRRLKEQRELPVILPPPDPNRPKVNVYLRPATLDDAYQTAELYNWYVENTFHVSEMVPISVQGMQDRLSFIERNSLPAILAILKSNEKPIRGAHPTLHSTKEKIVGFAYAEDHEGRDKLHRYCAEVEVYVHQEYLGKGVGKSLLDRLMWLLDPQYKSRDLVEWRVDPDDLAWSIVGGRRIINTLFANATFNSNDKTRLIWISRWLEQFGFVKKAELDDCGIKLGHASTKVIFQAKTGANVDPKSAVGVTPL